jgi:hypothetical protein
MAQSREMVKADMPRRWRTLARKSAKRVDALLHAIVIADLSTDLDRGPLRNVLIAEYESHLYHQARADGAEHRAALNKSRRGRLEVDALAGWA